MSCKCYKSIARPSLYVKTDGKAYWSIRADGGGFSVCYFPGHFENHHHDVFTEVDEHEVDVLFDEFNSRKLDIDIAHQRAKPNKRITACLEQAKQKIE